MIINQTNFRRHSKSSFASRLMSPIKLHKNLRYLLIRNFLMVERIQTMRNIVAFQIFSCRKSDWKRETMFHVISWSGISWTENTRCLYKIVEGVHIVTICFVRALSPLKTISLNSVSAMYAEIPSISCENRIKKIFQQRCYAKLRQTQINFCTTSINCEKRVWN